MNNVIIFLHRNAVAHDAAVIAETNDLPRELEAPRSSKLRKSLKYGRYSSSQEKSQHRRRASSSWFDAGTVDVFGIRQALVRQRAALRDHIFECEGYSTRLVFNRAGQVGVFVFIVLTICTLSIGAVLPSFSFRVVGLAGIVMDAGAKHSGTQEYSLLSIPGHLYAQRPLLELVVPKLGLSVYSGRSSHFTSRSRS